MNKKTIAAGVAAGVIGVLGFLSLQDSLDLQGIDFPYYKLSESDISSRIVLDFPAELVPRAVFYSLEVGGSEIGFSPFGTGDGVGVATANILLNPIDDVGVIIYDGKKEEIGRGNLDKDGTAKIKVSKDEVEL